MKRFVSVLLTFTLLFLVTACTQRTERDESSAYSSEAVLNESKSGESIEDSDVSAEESKAAQKPWRFTPLTTLRERFNSGLLDESIYRILINEGKDGIIRDRFMRSLCDKDGEYLNTALLRGYSNVGIYQAVYEYLPDGVLEYRVELIDDAGDYYTAYIGLMPEQYKGMSAEEFINSATDYYELFDMKSGSVLSADTEINYVYRERNNGINAFSLAVLYEKWFVLILPSALDSHTAIAPWRVFDKMVYEKRSYTEQGAIDIISCAFRTNEYTVVERYKDIETYRYTVYSNEGKPVSEFEAKHFFPLMSDESKRICLRQKYEDNKYSSTYCNAFGEELLMNNAEYLFLFDGEKGEYIGTENGIAYIYDGDDNRREYGSDYEVLTTLGKTTAVKLNDAIYGLLQNGKFVRLYETDFHHEDAALEYNEQHKAIFVGGDAITEIVNRYGEIIEAYWYDNWFETDVSGKYVLTSDSMSLYGNTYILDALTLKAIARLPNGADYEILHTGKLLVYYYDFENNDNYVEFEVEIEDAVRCFPFDEDSDGCDCFDGYPTPEDFE